LARLGESFDRRDRADAVVLVLGLRRPSQLRRRSPVTVGARRDSAACADQLLRVVPAGLEVGAEIGGFLPALRGRLLAFRRRRILLGVGALLLRFVLRLEM